MPMNNLMALIRLHGNVVSPRNIVGYSSRNKDAVVGRVVTINNRIKMEMSKNKKPVFN